MSNDTFYVTPESRIYEKCIEWAQYQFETNKPPPGDNADDSENKNNDNEEEEVASQSSEIDYKMKKTPNLDDSTRITTELNNHVDYLRLLKYHIRLPLLSSDFFSQSVVGCNLLTSEEETLLKNYFDPANGNNSQIQSKVRNIWGKNNGLNKRKEVEADETVEKHKKFSVSLSGMMIDIIENAFNDDENDVKYFDGGNVAARKAPKPEFDLACRFEPWFKTMADSKQTDEFSDITITVEETSKKKKEFKCIRGLLSIHSLHLQFSNINNSFCLYFSSFLQVSNQQTRKLFLLFVSWARVVGTSHLVVFLVFRDCFFIFFLFFCTTRSLFYDSNPNARELTIGKGMSIQGFKYLKDFCYGLQPAITNHNVGSVSTMNEQFRIPSIRTNILVYRLTNSTNANEIMQVLADGAVLNRKVTLYNPLLFFFICRYDFVFI